MTQACSCPSCRSELYLLRPERPRACAAAVGGPTRNNDVGLTAASSVGAVSCAITTTKDAVSSWPPKRRAARTSCRRSAPGPDGAGRRRAPGPSRAAIGCRAHRPDCPARRRGRHSVEFRSAVQGRRLRAGARRGRGRLTHRAAGRGAKAARTVRPRSAPATISASGLRPATSSTAAASRSASTVSALVTHDAVRGGPLRRGLVELRRRRAAHRRRTWRARRRAADAPADRPEGRPVAAAPGPASRGPRFPARSGARARRRDAAPRAGRRPWSADRCPAGSTRSHSTACAIGTPAPVSRRIAPSSPTSPASLTITAVSAAFGPGEEVTQQRRLALAEEPGQDDEIDPAPLAPSTAAAPAARGSGAGTSSAQLSRTISRTSASSSPVS